MVFLCLKLKKCYKTCFFMFLNIKVLYLPKRTMALFDFFKKKKNLDYIRGFEDITEKYVAIDTDSDLLTAYQITPTLKAIIDKTAEVFAKCKIKEFAKNDEELFNTPTLNLFANPHSLYSENEFLQTLSKEFQLFNKVYIYINRQNLGGLISENDTMLILPADKITPIIKKNIDIKNIQNINDYILYYDFEFNNKIIRFETYEIISINGTSLSNNFQTVDGSRKVLELPINSILSAYGVRNNLQRKNGGFGILTKEGGTENILDSNSELDEDEIENVQKQLKKYSFSRNNYQNIITSMRIKWQPMTYEIKTMSLPESIQNAKADLCDILNFPILSLNSLEGSTFSNMEISDKKLYTDSIIPLWELFEKEFNRQNFTLNKIKFDYSHIEALQGDKKTELETTKLKDDIEMNRYFQGFITKNEALINMELEEITGGNDYFVQPIKPEKNV